MEICCLFKNYRKFVCDKSIEYKLKNEENKKQTEE